jgi:hypothetical protein
MRKLVLAVVFSALMATTSVLAAKHDTPGNPTEKNCHGQTIAFFAQFGPAVNASHPGLGGFMTFTPQELQALARLVCAGGE